MLFCFCQMFVLRQSQRLFEFVNNAFFEVILNDHNNGKFRYNKSVQLYSLNHKDTIVNRNF